jgi:hypothetical protein
MANGIGRMDVIAEMLVESEPIDVPSLEDRRQTWITALGLTGSRATGEDDRLRSVIAGSIQAGVEGRPDLGLAFLQFASARSWWQDPASRSGPRSRRPPSSSLPRETIRG